MKLIIDIPEKVVTAIQNGEDYRYDIHTAIAQGIPYEERPQGEWVRKEDVIQSIAKQYIEHNELVPVWLSIGDLKGGAE